MMKIIVLQDNGFNKELKNAWETDLSQEAEEYILKMMEENDMRDPAGIIAAEIDMSAMAYKG